MAADDPDFDASADTGSELDASEPEGDGEYKNESDNSHEAFWATNSVDKWEPVPRLEIGLLWGIPSVVLAVVTVATISHASGQSEAINPFEQIPWLWPLCVMLGVSLLVVPFFRGWRAHVVGGSLRIVKKTAVEDEIQIEIFNDSIKLGTTTYGANDGKLFRWEQFTPPQIGWMLKLDGAILTTRETNVTRWEGGTAKRKEKPESAWNAPPHEFWNVCETLNIKH